MAEERFDNVSIHVHRSESDGLYYLEVEIDGVRRRFSALKQGKLDQLRAKAAAERASTPPPPSAA